MIPRRHYLDLLAGAPGWAITQVCEEIERLEKERDYWKRDADNLRASERAADAKIESLHTEVARLEDALTDYGEHSTGCRYGEPRPDAECTCGLEAAINGQTAGA